MTLITNQRAASTRKYHEEPRASRMLGVRMHRARMSTRWPTMAFTWKAPAERMPHLPEPGVGRREGQTETCEAAQNRTPKACEDEEVNQ